MSRQPRTVSALLLAAAETLIRASRGGAGALWVLRPGETLSGEEMAVLRKAASRLNLTLTACDGGYIA